MDKDTEGILLLFFGCGNLFRLCCGCALSWLRVKSWLDRVLHINDGGGGAISTERKDSPLILKDILYNHTRLCQPSDQSKRNYCCSSLVLCLAFLLVCCFCFLVTSRSDNNPPDRILTSSLTRMCFLLVEPSFYLHCLTAVFLGI